MKEELLKIEKLCRDFETDSGTQRVLNNIDLTIYKGDFTVIMGSSGSGKSTLLYSLSGMDTITSGHIRLGDTDLSSLSGDEMAIFRREHCGFVFQQICLINSMSILDNVLAAGLLRKCNKKQLVQRAKELLASVQVEEHTWSKFPTQISGGRAQRVGIVRALINNPDILFADEPTGALNSQTGNDVLDLFTRFNREGQSTIMVTHDVKSAIRGNRVLYLRDGKLLDECDLGTFDGNIEERIGKLNRFLGEMGW
ncbi:MAG: ABC transporter ATP-binding protein [Clostridia bacterium]|nr:ABC transporter ATP-binding protein [Clostridia bacterium]